VSLSPAISKSLTLRIQRARWQMQLRTTDVIQQLGVQAAAQPLSELLKDQLPAFIYSRKQKTAA